MFYVIYTYFKQAKSTIPSQVDPDKCYVLKSAEKVKYFICLVKNYCAWTHNQFGSQHISHHTLTITVHYRVAFSLSVKVRPRAQPLV